MRKITFMEIIKKHCQSPNFLNIKSTKHHQECTPYKPFQTPRKLTKYTDTYYESCIEHVQLTAFFPYTFFKTSVTPALTHRTFGSASNAMLCTLGVFPTKIENILLLCFLSLFTAIMSWKVETVNFKGLSVFLFRQNRKIKWSSVKINVQYSLNTYLADILKYFSYFS